MSPLVWLPGAAVKLTDLMWLASCTAFTALVASVGTPRMERPHLPRPKAAGLSIPRVAPQQQEEYLGLREVLGLAEEVGGRDHGFRLVPPSGSLGGQRLVHGAVAVVVLA